VNTSDARAGRVRVPAAAVRPEPRAAGYLSLFTSFGTLVCCALPSLLVLVGLGTTVASVLAAAPWLVTLSRHKVWVFGISGSLIAANAAYVYWLAPRWRAGSAGCAADRASACATSDRASRVLLWTSIAMYAAGFFVAFVLGPLLVRFG
jgi:mercuric ion transport protein